VPFPPLTQAITSYHMDIAGCRNPFWRVSPWVLWWRSYVPRRGRRFHVIDILLAIDAVCAYLAIYIRSWCVFSTRVTPFCVAVRVSAIYAPSGYSIFPRLTSRFAWRLLRYVSACTFVVEDFSVAGAGSSGVV